MAAAQLHDSKLGLASRCDRHRFSQTENDAVGGLSSLNTLGSCSDPLVFSYGFVYWEASKAGASLKSPSRRLAKRHEPERGPFKCLLMEHSQIRHAHMFFLFPGKPTDIVKIRHTYICLFSGVPFLLVLKGKQQETSHFLVLL